MKKSAGFFGVFSLVVLLTACGRGDESTATAAPSETAASKAPAKEQQVELIDRALLLGNPDRSQGRLSPDGRMMSFRAPLDGVMNIWVAPAGDIDAAEPITRDTGRGIPRHFWTLDSRRILFTRDRNGDENWHLYSVDLDSGEITDLSPYDGVQAQMVAQGESHPGIAIVGMNDRDPRWHDLYRVDLETAERELLLENDGFAGFHFDHDLQLRLATRTTSSGGFRVLEKRGDDWQEIFEVGLEDSFTTQILGFDGDNRGIYMLDSRGRDKAALTHYLLQSGDSQVLAEPASAEIGQVLMHPREHKPIAYSINLHTNHWNSLDDRFSADIDALEKQADGDISILGATRDAARWIIYAARDSASDAYQVYSRDGRQLDKLFDVTPELNDLPLANTYPQTIPSRDGLDLVSYLTLPVEKDLGGEVKAPVPMVLLVHGGPWSRDNFADNGAAPWLANRGYAVLQVNYRGSTGFGKAFINAGHGEWAGAMHDDLIDAVDWAIGQGITTPDQVAIMGGSYGGYATLVGLTFTPETFACGVDIVGPSSLNTLIDSIPPYWEAFRNTLHAAVGNPETEAGKKMLAERSPLTYADRIVRPLLIGQGANDPRVKQAESDQIVSAMKKREIPVTYILYPDEGHGFHKPENRLSFFAATESFLADCLDGRHQPIGDDLDGSSIQVVHGAGFVPGLSQAVDKAKVIATNTVDSGE
ncbi:S9 family peptidase [Microbulbifer litoralis]|uniref:S9 family peptidase n=1 Tax=Microbulbifer litoralis TaxID=2933965 RepID=UPI002027E82B|nr:S9 family peptidase [Microbulbifer sp. GX H0434]